MKEYESKMGELWLKKFKKASPEDQNFLVNLHHNVYPSAGEYKASLKKPKDEYSPRTPEETLSGKQNKLEMYEDILKAREEARKKIKKEKERTA